MPEKDALEAIMTTRRFDKLILGVAAVAVLATAAATMVNPSKGVTAAPRVAFDQMHAEAAHLNEAVRNVAPDGPETASIAGGLGLQVMDDTMLLAEAFADMGYDLENVKRSGAAVPRVYLVKLPGDLHAVPEVSLKKTVFFHTMLPLILQENERILADRRRLMRIKTEKALGQKVSPGDRLWLAVLADRYKTSDDKLQTLLARVDVIPPSLALSQAAEESGWGTSRFAQRGNALFGQWTSADDHGLVPKDREAGMAHKIKAFGTLGQSVSAYMRNLNTHAAYRSLRKVRTQLRAKGAPMDGHILTGALTKYSERGEKYVDSIRLIIEANDLRPLDDARLTSDDESA